jgi:hypothetical protein
MIRCIHNHAFSIKFDNHYTLTALFSKLNHCSRYDRQNKGMVYDDAKDGIIEAASCEVTILDNKGNVVIFGDSISMQYVKPDQLAKLILKTSIALCHSDIVNDYPINVVQPWE